MSNVARSLLRRRRRPAYFVSDPFSFTRRASTRHPFPFPARTDPTPHEIFHLPRSASQDEIKTRYYELVKVYHPDATHVQHDVAPSVRIAQFRAVTHAYGVLRGRLAPSSGRGWAWDHRDEVMRAELRRRARRSRPSSTVTPTDDLAHERRDDAQVLYALVGFLLVGAVAAMGSVNVHMDRVERHTRSAAANLAEARAEAQVHGMERRRKIREFVKSFRDVEEAENHDPPKGRRDGVSGEEKVPGTASKHERT